MENDFFTEMDDGFLMGGTPAMTFLIGETGEKVSHLGLWVSPAIELSYRMVSRVRPSDDYDPVESLKKEADRLVHMSTVIGGQAFMSYINKQQKTMDTIMWWMS